MARRLNGVRLRRFPILGGLGWVLFDEVKQKSNEEGMRPSAGLLFLQLGLDVIWKQFIDGPKFYPI